MLGSWDWCGGKWCLIGHKKDDGRARHQRYWAKTGKRFLGGVPVSVKRRLVDMGFPDSEL